MKYFFCSVLVALVFSLSGFGNDVYGSQDINENELESNVSLVVMKNTSMNFMNITSNKILVGQKIRKTKRFRRRRLRRLRKKNPQNLMANMTNSATNSPHPNKGRRLKKHRKNKLVPSSTTERVKYRNMPSLIESRNLVLPMSPTQLSPTTTLKKIVRKPVKNTRCSKNNGGCAHVCLIKGIQKCQCLKGFQLGKNMHSCTDINECETNNGNCQMNCTNSIGSYSCHCPTGLRLSDNLKTCEDVNECLLRNGHGPCQDSCENSYGSYKCSCKNLKGTKLDDDLQSCVDVNECEIANGGCSHNCINAFGKSFCSCPAGFELSGDFKTCKDIDECQLEYHKAQCLSECINTVGSYKCADLTAMQNDESFKNVACKPLFPPKIGYYKCSRKHALKSLNKNGRRRVKNSIGTRCILVCPHGYKRKGSGFRKMCGFGGDWVGNFDAECVPQT
ncbi:fibulin-1-like isoform X1 [Anthonomus grandis grandis]|uniref:fibulin-1-like isoform X1 n=1 Tax=Anthonomus grandis grandis TaxID=2921223 RepID=UPI002165C7C0|nr:fibulin-1-like isoform X1 [Anthonomus grandis grandis]